MKMNLLTLTVAIYLQLVVITRVYSLPLAGSRRNKTSQSKEDHFLRTALKRQRRGTHISYLYTVNTGKFVKVTSRVVHANSSKDDKYAELILTTMGSNGTLHIQGKQSKRFLCMKKGKVVSWKEYKKRQCLFIMRLENNGYMSFRLASNETKYLGFKRNGAPRLGHKTESHHKAARIMKE